MTPTFSQLPTVDCPEWAPETVQTEYKALCDARQAIETERAGILEALRKARNDDLAVFTPVQFNPRPMLQQELLWLRSVDAFYRSVSSAADAYRKRCDADAERAREEVKKRLVKAGYVEPAGDAPIRGSYTPVMVQSHELVRSAAEKSHNATAFDLGPNIRANRQAIADVESKLRDLLISVA